MDPISFDQETADFVKEYFADIDADICPECKQPIANQRQVSCCVYAEPCGHRLYHGTIAERFRVKLPETKRMFA